MYSSKKSSELFLALLALLCFVSQSSGKAVCHDHISCDQVKCQDNLDIAIVGAGPAGTYSAYKLRHNRKTVGVYEYSDRVGGRLFTYKLPNTQDVNLEIGGMRFIEDAHNRLEQAVEELGLHRKHFTEGFGRKGRMRFYLRNQSLSYQEVLNGEVPYQLNQEEKKNQHRIHEYFLEKLTNYTMKEGQNLRDVLLKLRVKDGRLLYQLTFDEALDLVNSTEGKAFLRDVHVFTSEVYDDASAIAVFDDHLGENAAEGRVFTIREGMSALPNKLLEAFTRESITHFLRKNQHLKSIRSKSDKSYVLYFEPTMTKKDETTVLKFRPMRVVCARQVILAIPVFALKQLDWPPLRESRAQNAYGAVKPMPASKVFMTFDQPWWLDENVVKNKAWVTKGDAPFSQMYDWAKSNRSGDYIMIASYADSNNTLYEKHLNSFGSAAKGSEKGGHKVSVQLKKTVLEHLIKAYGAKASDVPEPKTTLSQFWTDYPFGAGWVTWKSGYHIDDVLHTMRRPSVTDEVYVVGADYSWGMMSSWVEGALETAEDVIKLYF